MFQKCRWLCLLSVIFLMGCQDIEDTIYVNSIGFDYQDKYEVYMYAASVMDNAQNSNQSTDNYPQIAYADGDNIVDCFLKIEASINEKINYELIQTLLLTPSYLENQKMEDIINYFGSKHQRTMDFCFFLTDDIKEIYSIENIDKAVSFNPIFLDPIGEKTIFNNVSFVDFVADYYEENRAIILPYLGLTDEIWEANNKKYRGIYAKGIGIYKDDIECIMIDDHPELAFLVSFNAKTIMDNGLIYEIRNYNLSMYNINNQIVITANAKIKPINEVKLSETKEYISTQIKGLIELTGSYDLFNANDFLKKRGYSGKNITYKHKLNITMY